MKEKVGLCFEFIYTSETSRIKHTKFGHGSIL